MEHAKELALEHLGLQNKGYKALFLQGGASMEFLMVAYNFLENKAGIQTPELGQTRQLKKLVVWRCSRDCIIKACKL